MSFDMNESFSWIDDSVEVCNRVRSLLKWFMLHGELSERSSKTMIRYTVRVGDTGYGLCLSNLPYPISEGMIDGLRPVGFSIMIVDVVSGFVSRYNFKIPMSYVIEFSELDGLTDIAVAGYVAKGVGEVIDELDGFVEDYG